MTLQDFIQKLKTQPETLDFEDTISTIEQHFTYTPVTFSNSELINNAGENEGSCKIFAFAQIMQLSEQDTLNCFGRFYHQDVIKHPKGNDHANIRQFMQTGWNGIKFNEPALTKKTS